LTVLCFWTNTGYELRSFLPWSSDFVSARSDPFWSLEAFFRGPATWSSVKWA
jgi:hypothetical protein